MANNVNVACISGNLTREPDVRQTGSGACVVRFGVAVSRSVKNQQGGYDEKPDYVDCVIFGKFGETIAQYLHKGTFVAIQGRLAYSSWQGDDGKKRSKLEVLVNEINWNNPQQAQQPAQQYQPQAYAPQPQYQPQPQQQYQQVPQPAPQQAYQPQAAPQPVPVQQAMPVQQMPDTSVYDEDIPF